MPTESFWEIHHDLPRQAPGSDETTARLFRAASREPSAGSAIDMGCGPGRSALFLAALGFDVVAIDTHDHFLDELRAAGEIKGLLNKIEAVHMSMDDIRYPDRSFDLVWAESTAYLIGWQTALRSWRRLLTPRGSIVATDCFWLTDQRSPEAVDFWSAGSGMDLSVSQAERIAREAGYSVDYQYVQPESDWAEYYGPMEQKLEVLRPAADAEMQEAIAKTEYEIYIRREYGSEYGHVGLVLTARD